MKARKKKEGGKWSAWYNDEIELGMKNEKVKSSKIGINENLSDLISEKINKS